MKYIQAQCIKSVLLEKGIKTISGCTNFHGNKRLYLSCKQHKCLNKCSLVAWSVLLESCSI